jgi:hypothetical protein
MSYLADFRSTPPRKDGARRIHFRWRSVKGSVLLVHCLSPGTTGSTWQCQYRRYSRLGALLSSNAESERHFVLAELRKHNIVPAAQSVEFVSVGN